MFERRTDGRTDGLIPILLKLLILLISFDINNLSVNVDSGALELEKAQPYFHLSYPVTTLA